MKNNKSIGKNGYNYILDTYNKNNFPILENKINATVFPWNMKRDVDYIDTMKFYNK